MAFGVKRLTRGRRHGLTEPGTLVLAEFNARLANLPLNRVRTRLGTQYHSVFMFLPPPRFLSRPLFSLFHIVPYSNHPVRMESEDKSGPHNTEQSAPIPEIASRMPGGLGRIVPDAFSLLSGLVSERGGGGGGEAPAAY